MAVGKAQPVGVSFRIGMPADLALTAGRPYIRRLASLDERRETARDPKDH